MRQPESKFNIHRDFHNYKSLPKWAQIQLENHYMVILNILKIVANVNDFQMRFNILLIINNSQGEFLVKVTLVFSFNFQSNSRNCV